MANTVYSGFGSSFGPTTPTMDVISAAANKGLIRVIQSQKGFRTVIRRIQTAPVPLDALAAGSVWKYLYFALATKFRYEQLTANNNAILNQGPLAQIGSNPPGQDLMGSTWVPIWLARPQLGVDPFFWDVNLSCENGDTIVIVCASGVALDYSTLTYTPETQHMDVLSVWGDDQIPLVDNTAFPNTVGKSQPRFDFAPSGR